MKPIIILIPVFLMTSCNNNNSNVPEKKLTDNATTSENANAPVSSSTMQTEDIVGEWEIVGSIVDTNDNLQIDEDERKNLKPTAFKDYMKLNSDGTGLFTVAKMEGRYEAKAKESNGKKYLTWYDKANGEHRIGTIIKVTKDELHIKEPGGSGLFIWKRL